MNVDFYKDMQFVYRNGTFYIASDRIVNEIFENKALDRNFVMQRFCYFLPRLSRELLQI